MGIEVHVRVRRVTKNRWLLQTFGCPTGFKTSKRERSRNAAWRDYSTIATALPQLFLAALGRDARPRKTAGFGR
jgi:hypothetical protein